MTATVLPADRPGPTNVSIGGMLRAGTHGLRVKRGRTALSALGVALGVAALVAVMGLSTSSQARLLDQLDALGTNLLVAGPGRTLTGDQAHLPVKSEAMVDAIGAVQASTSVTVISRRDRTSQRVCPAHQHQRHHRHGERSRHSGRAWHQRHPRPLARPSVDLAADSCPRRDDSRATGGGPGTSIWVDDMYLSVIGVLDASVLVPSIDTAVLMGRPAAEVLLDAPTAPSSIFVRADPDEVDGVRAVLPATANPERPEEIDVSRPSDALEARAAAEGTFTALFLGLGAVALMIGGVGIANVMIISVLERRREIGLRRAIGATRRHIGAQFIIEAAALAGVGGVAGAGLGTVATFAYAISQGWRTVVTAASLVGGTTAAVLIGVVAGAYPAWRAARLTPTEALRSP